MEKLKKCPNEEDFFKKLHSFLRKSTLTEIINSCETLEYKQRNQIKYSQSYLYFLFDAKELVYIGMTTNLALRILSHNSKPDPKKFDSFCYIGTSSRYKFLSETEAVLIKKFRPKYNIAHNPNNWRATK